MRTIYEIDETTRIQDKVSYQAMYYRSITVLMSNGKNTVAKQIMQNIEYVHEIGGELNIISPYTY